MALYAGLCVFCLFFISAQTISKAEILHDISACTEEKCFSKPTDIAISSDGSFLLLVDSSQNPFLQRIDFAQGVFNKHNAKSLNIENPNKTTLKIGISKDNSKAFVFKKVSKNDKSSVLIIDLASNNITTLNSVNSDSKQATSVNFLDISGSTILLTRGDKNSNELVIIDTKTDTIKKSISIKGTGNDIQVSPDGKKAIITYSGTSSQSFTIYDIEKETTKTIEIPTSLFFQLDDFLSTDSFDLFGKGHVLSSLNGKHVLHYIDLKNNEFILKILNDNLSGTTNSVLSPDGKIAISVGTTTTNKKIGFVVYKTSLKDLSAPIIEKSATFSEDGVVVDIKITPDQNKVLIVFIKDKNKKLKVLDISDLTTLSELDIANNDITFQKLALDPFGRYAILPILTKTQNSIQAVSIPVILELDPAPVLRSIEPNQAAKSSPRLFTIKGFVDPTRFNLNSLKVCFKDGNNCASNVKVSPDGFIITGQSPRSSSTGIQDLILSVKTGETTNQNKKINITWNPDDKQTDIVLLNDNLTATTSFTSLTDTVRTTTGKTSGKWYFEIITDTVSTNQNSIGVAPKSLNVDHLVGTNDVGCGYSKNGSIACNGKINTNNINNFQAKDVIGVAVDLDNQKIYFSKNGQWQGGGNPDILTGGFDLESSIGTEFFPAITISKGFQYTANFGHTDFLYPIPSGFKPYDDGEGPTAFLDGAKLYNVYFNNIIPVAYSNENHNLLNPKAQITTCVACARPQCKTNQLSTAVKDSCKECPRCVFVKSIYQEIFEFIGDSTLTDTSPPEINILEPKEKALLNTREVIIKGTVDGTGSGVDKVLINNNEVKISKGENSKTAEFEAKINFQSDGLKTITIQAFDGAKNEAKTEIVIGIDSTKPELQNVKATRNTNGEVVISGTALGTGSNIEKIVVNNLNIKFQPAEKVDFSATTNKKPVIIKVIDRAGNELTTEVKVENEDNKPIITIISPEDGTAFRFNDIFVVGRINGNGSSISTIFINGFKARFFKTTGDEVVFFQRLQFKQEGTFEINVKATNASEISSERTIKITIDKTVPIITAKIEDAGEGKFRLTGNVNGTGSNITEITVDGRNILTNTDPKEAIDFEVLINKPNATITASDKAGNKGSKFLSVTGEELIPIITVNSPKAGSLVRNSIFVSGEIDGNSSSVKKVKINGQNARTFGSGRGKFIVAFISHIQFPDDGEKTITIEASNAAGKSSTLEIKVIVDNTPPLIDASIEEIGENEFRVFGTVKDKDSNIKIITVDNANIKIEEAKEVQFSTTVAKPAVRIFAYDSAFNFQEVIVSAKSKAQEPIIEINSPQEGFTTNRPQFIFIHGIIDGNGGDVLKVTINGKDIKVKKQRTVRFFHQLRFDSDGEKEITVTASNTGGKTSTKSVKIFIDTTKPTIDSTIEQTGKNEYKVTGKANGTGSNIVSITINNTSLKITPASSVDISTTINTPVAKITVQDAAFNIESKTITAPGGENTPIITINFPKDQSVLRNENIFVSGNVDGNGSSVTSVLVNNQKPRSFFKRGNTASFFHGLNFPDDGKYLINVETTNAIGKSTETTISITLDTKDPILTTQVEQTEDGKFKINGTVDGTGSKIVSIGLDNKEIDFQKQEIVEFSVTVNSLPVTLVIRDEAFNFTTRNITLSDTLPPKITIDTPKNNNLLNKSTVKVTGTIDGTGSKVQKVKINNKDIKTSSTGFGQNVVSFSEELSLKDGEHQITVFAKDGGGNTKEETVKVKIDTLPPAIDGQVELSNEGKLSLNLKVNGTGSEVDSIKVNSENIEFNKQEKVELTLEISGSKVKIEATDKAGNTAGKDIEVNIATLITNLDAQNIDNKGTLANEQTTNNAWIDLASGNNGLLNNFSLPTNGESGWRGNNTLENPSSLFFDGKNDFVDLTNKPSVSPQGSFTYSIWINVESFINGSLADSNGTYFIDRKFTGTGAPLVSLKAVRGEFGFQVRYDDGSGLGGVAGGKIENNKWYFVNLVRDYKKAFRLYVNGVEVANKPDDGKSLTPDIPKLGSHADERVPFFDGKIAKFRIHRIVLGARQIRDIFEQEKINYIPKAECEDNIDNDKDGLIDFSNDPDCTSKDDESEAPEPALGAQLDAKNIDGKGTPASKNVTDSKWFDLSRSNNNGNLVNFSLPANNNSGWTGKNTTEDPSALSFDGIDDFVNLDKRPLLSPQDGFTYSIWINVENYTNGNLSDENGTYFIDRKITNNDRPLVSLKAVSDRFAFQVRYDDGSGLGGPLSVNGIVLKQWHLINLVRDYNKAFRIYVNGEEAGSIQDNGKALTPEITKLGSHNNERLPFFDGKIANFRIHKRTLSGQEIKELFENEKADFIKQPQCSDKKDNDNDGKIDFPDDSDCSSINDDSEFPPISISPIITITKPKDNEIFNKQKLEVSGTVEGPSGKIIEVKINGKDADKVKSIEGGTNKKEFSSTVSFKEDGKQEIKVFVKDDANNTAEKTISITIDTVSPIIDATIKQDESGSGKFKVEGTANGTGTNVDSIKINGNDISFTKGEKVQFTESILQGTAIIKVKDKAGNEATKEIKIVQAKKGTWTGASGNNNWSDKNNWGNNILPGPDDIVIFDGSISNVNAKIDIDVNVKGIEIKQGYKGSITQQVGKKIQLGASGFTQSDGTFVATGDPFISQGDFTLNDGIFTYLDLRLRTSESDLLNQSSGDNNSNLTIKDLRIRGGTFTAPPGTLTILGIVKITGGVFNHNNGTIVFSTGGCSHLTKTIDVKETLTINNAITKYTGTCGVSITYKVTDKDKLILVGSLTQGSKTALSGLWNLNGNLIVEENAAGGDGIVTLVGNANQTYSSGGGRLPILHVNKSSGSVSQASATTSLATNGFSLVSGTFTAPSGNFSIAGDLIQSSGTFNHNNGTIIFDKGGCTHLTHTIDVPSMLEVNNVVTSYAGTCGVTITYKVADGDKLIVLGNFTQKDRSVISGNWEIQGNITFEKGAGGGNATITASGNKNQNINATIFPTGLFTINKSAGIVVLLQDLTLSNSQLLNITSGTLDQGKNANIEAGEITIAQNGILQNLGTGDLTLGGNLTNNGLVNLDGEGIEETNEDPIKIRSAQKDTQRTWSGNGKFTLKDVDIKDQIVGTPPGSIFVSSGTDSGNNKGFVFEETKLIIEISLPKDKEFLNTLDVEVQGTVKTVGTKVKSVLVNEQEADIKPTSDPSVVEFTKKISFNNDGTHTINVKAKDNNNLLQEKSITITIDTKLPEITSFNIDTNDKDEFVLTATASGTGSKITGIKVNGQDVQFTQAEIVEFTAISSSTSSFNVQIVDEAKNKLVRELKPGGENPQIDVSKPDNNAFFKIKDIETEGTVTYFAPKKVFKINDTEMNLSPTSQSNVFTFKKTLSLSDGRHSITYLAKDKLKRVTTTTRTVTVDTRAPIISGSVDAEEDNFKLSSTIIDETTKITSIEIKDKDGNPINTVTLQDGSTIDLKNFKPTSTFTFTVVHPKNEFTIKAIDEASNSSESKIVPKDLSAPSISYTEPNDGAILNTRTILVKGLISDSDSPINKSKTTLTTTSETTAQTTILKLTDVENSGGKSVNFEKTFTFKADGVHTVEVTTKDLLNNNAKSSISFTVDSTPPIIQGSISVTADDKFSLKLDLDGTGSEISSVSINGDSVAFTPGKTVSITQIVPSNTASIEVKDKAGHITKKEIKIADALKPAISVSSPTNDSFINTKTVTINGTVNGTGSGVKIVKVNNETVETTISSQDPNIVSFTKTITYTEEGIKLISIFAQDKSLNEDTQDIKITIDIKEPTLSASIIKNLDEGFTLSGIADGTGSPIEEILVDNAPLKITQDKNVSFKTKINKDSANVSVKDKAGNKLVKEISILEKDPPLIKLDAPKQNFFYKTRKIKVAGKVEDASSISKILVGDKEIEFNLSSDKLTATINTDVIHDKDGNFELAVTAFDTLNNKSEEKISINIDTVLPTLTIKVTPKPGEGNTIEGTANGTGSNIIEIKIDDEVIKDLKPAEQVDFTATTKNSEAKIEVVDAAGNNLIKTIALSEADITPPTITITSPTNGTVFTDSADIDIFFEVTDNVEVNTVKFNDEVLLPSGEDKYSTRVHLSPGENLFTIEAADFSKNTSTLKLSLTFSPPPPKPGGGGGGAGGGLILTLPPAIPSSIAIIEGVIEPIIEEDLPDTIELANPPPIPPGEEAVIVLVPELEGLEIKRKTGEPIEIPRGCSFATIIGPKNQDVAISDEDINNRFSTIYIDGTGRSYVAGFAFFARKKSESIDSDGIPSYKTKDGKLLRLITTLKLPLEATEGEGKITILNKDKPIAIIPITLTSEKEIKTRKRARSLDSPEITGKVKAFIRSIEKEFPKLILKIKANNLLKKVAIIDGELTRVKGQGNFLTRVFFIPEEDIRIKKARFEQKNKLTVISDIDKDIEPGLKLFNITTPKCADIGALIIPSELSAGPIEVTDIPESLILEELIKRQSEKNN